MKYYLQLMRPANLVTAIADILAGLSIAKFAFSTEFLSIQPAILLCIATIGLYGGGVVFNDVFDANLDAVERPERAIPSGKVSKINATIFGLI
ncbi:MAG: UbiA family prenyltransferase, partial [Bacteroidota bacterium]